jgi:alpha,alpha-trehalose phosphorylase
MVQCPDSFTPEQKAQNFAYYERVTVRDSSLSPGTLAVMAAETGHLDLAYDYLCESAQMDLADLEHNVRDGIHLAALASSWTAIVQGLGGMRTHNGKLSFAPRLPSAVSGLRFRVLWRGRSIHLEIGHGEALYTLEEVAEHPSGPSGMTSTSTEALDLRHHDEDFTLIAGEPVTLAIPAAPPRGPIDQPPGRAPLFRRLHQ